MTTGKNQDRQDRLMPLGIPKWIRCYDNGGQTPDRYIVVFTGNYRGKPKTGGRAVTSCFYISASTYPCHPQGYGMHGEAPESIDRPRYGHLGKKVKFTSLPEEVQKFAISTYKSIWKLG